MINVEQIEDLIENLTINDIVISNNIITIINQKLIKNCLNLNDVMDIQCSYNIHHQVRELELIIFNISKEFNTYYTQSSKYIFRLNDNVIRHKFSALRYELKEKQYYENLLKLCHTGK